MDKIIVVAYDPHWPVLFGEIAERVHAAFVHGPLSRIEHVGSTSVPGLSAKPVIDIDVVIPTRADLPEAIARLTALGYTHQGDLGVTSREAFRWLRESPCHNLYVCAEDSPELRRHLVFRDYLRAHSDDARRYADLKHKLAEQFSDNREAYTDGKAEYIQAVLRKAAD